jgi:hypothetical protein
MRKTGGGRRPRGRQGDPAGGVPSAGAPSRPGGSTPPPAPPAGRPTGPGRPRRPARPRAPGPPADRTRPRRRAPDRPGPGAAGAPGTAGDADRRAAGFTAPGPRQANRPAGPARRADGGPPDAPGAGRGVRDRDARDGRGPPRTGACRARPPRFAPNADAARRPRAGFPSPDLAAPCGSCRQVPAALERRRPQGAPARSPTPAPRRPPGDGRAGRSPPPVDPLYRVAAPARRRAGVASPELARTPRQRDDPSFGGGEAAWSPRLTRERQCAHAHITTTAFALSWPRQRHTSRTGGSP